MPPACIQSALFSDSSRLDSGLVCFCSYATGIAPMKWRRVLFLLLFLVTLVLSLAVSLPLHLMESMRRACRDGNGTHPAKMSQSLTDSSSRLILTEGVFTILLGIFAYIFMPDCKNKESQTDQPLLILEPVPDTARWMSEEEKAFVQARLPINAPRAAEKDFDWKEFWHTLKDHKLWLFLLCWAFYTIGTTGLNFYQPTVIANLGFT